VFDLFETNNLFKYIISDVLTEGTFSWTFGNKERMRTRELINILYVESRVDASGHYVLIKDLAALERGINKEYKEYISSCMWLLLQN
ncbi:MAG: hypothetical protein ACK559_41750, partial [bacterium]